MQEPHLEFIRESERERGGEGHGKRSSNSLDGGEEVGVQVKGVGVGGVQEGTEGGERMYFGKQK